MDGRDIGRAIEGTMGCLFAGVGILLALTIALGGTVIYLLVR